MLVTILPIKPERKVVNAIKALRTATGWGLIESKEVMDIVRNNKRAQIELTQAQYASLVQSHDFQISGFKAITAEEDMDTLQNLKSLTASAVLDEEYAVAKDMLSVLQIHQKARGY